MKVCIHRGTKEIGGTCVEIESQDKRLVLDVGLPLETPDPDSIDLHPVRGFDAPDESLLGVVISHPHQDHYGLAHRLPEETLFLIGEAAERILSAAALFSPAGLRLKNVRRLTDRTPIKLGPFTITPFLVDHSAYDAYAVLVEAEGRRLFYTGDFRAHGRKASLTERLIADPPQGVDVLLMEGTCIGRDDQEFPTEDDLVPRLVDIFQQTSGMPLVWCSGQNLDRIVTVWKACRKADRQFIIDMYTAEMLRATGNDRMPQADWDGIRVFLPATQRWRIKNEGAFHVSDSYKPCRIHWNQLAGAAPTSVMLFRPSMVRDLERAGCLKDACVICSEWAGYLEKESNLWFVDWMKRNGISNRPCHTSGHASIPDLRRMRDAFSDAIAVPIHLEDRGRFVDCSTRWNYTTMGSGGRFHSAVSLRQATDRRSLQMSSDSSPTRLKPIGDALALHEIIASVRQLSYMKQHSKALLDTLNVKLEITYARAPVGRQAKHQTYELQRAEKSDPAVRERLLEKLIWKGWRFQAVAEHGQPFLNGVCRFIQTYQMPLQGTRKDSRWGKIDLVGATPDALPVVIELKQEDATDTPLRMLVEGLAYACAVRKAWNEGGLRAEWAAAMKKNGLHQEPENVLAKVPVILLAPVDFWQRAVGTTGKRTSGKVREDAWPVFLELVRRCDVHGFPVHFVQFETETVDDPGVTKVVNVSAVSLPGMAVERRTAAAEP